MSLAASGALAQLDDSTARRAFGGIQPAISPDGRVIALSYQGAICRLPSEGGPSPCWATQPTAKFAGQLKTLLAPESPPNIAHLESALEASAHAMLKCQS